MKRLNPDLIGTINSRYIQQLAFLRKFKRLWGTTMVDGIEVFNPKVYYHGKSHNKEKMDKLLAFLHMKSQVRDQDMKGIKSAWLYLDPNKAKDSEEEWDKISLVNNLRKAHISTISTTVSIGPNLKNEYTFTPPKLDLKAEDPSNPAEAQEYNANLLKSTYKELWEGNYSFTTEEADPYRSLIALYALVSDLPCTIKNVRETTTSTIVNSGRRSRTVSSRSYRFEIEIPRPTYTEKSKIVDDILKVAGSKSSKFNTQITNRLILLNEDEDESFDNDYYTPKISLSGLWYEKATQHSSMDEDGNVTTWVTYAYYLRADILDNKTLSLSDRSKYISELISSDYKKKPTKWYNVVIVVALVIVATIFAGPAGSAAAAAVGGGILGTVVLVAVTITVASMYLTLALAAASMSGFTNLTGAMASFQATVQPLVRVAQIVALVAAISQVVRRGVELAATEASKGEIAKQVTKEVATSVGEMMGVTFSDNAFTASVQMLNTAFGIYAKNQQNRDQVQIKRYQSELAELREAQEQSKVRDIVKDLMLSYPNLLANDNSHYSEIYDKPYEWWSTPFHTGNIQTTSIQMV